MPPRIVVDEREKRSGIPDLLWQAGALIDFAQLKVGDYIVSPDTAIERKTIQDLLNSIYDGRLFVQCSQLNEHYTKPVLVVEGNIVDLIDVPEEDQAVTEHRDTAAVKEEFADTGQTIDKARDDEEDQLHEAQLPKRRGKINQGKINADDTLQRSLKGQNNKSKSWTEKIPLIHDALVKIAFDFRIPIIHTPSADFTSQLLVVMVNKSLQNGRATGPLLKRIKKGNPRYIQQLSILSSVPGVGDKLAIRMLDKFHTPSRALNASAAELSRISGFGTERAARVRRILDSAIDQRDNNNIATPTPGVGEAREGGLQVIQRTLLDDSSFNNHKQVNND
ncbi:MAG: helix-hairpin-helix domain-containing protein [Thermoproteota archaeon]|nr:helix-hairpin-helix domain-containing protein [Thermoproteota archaeon]